MRALLFALMLLFSAPWALADEWSRLTDLSQERGSVRVIVQLDEATVPEGFLSMHQRASQQARIQEVQQRVLERLAVTAIRRFSRIPGMVLRADLATLQALRDDPAVRHVSEDRLYRPLLSDSIPRIQANTLWAEGGTGSGWAVAVLDTGVDYGHEFFGDRVVAEACFSSNEENLNATTLCPDGEETSYAERSGMDCSDISGCGHGTHVAGIAAGFRDDNFAGVAKGAGIIAIQVFSKIDDSLASFESDQIAALDHVRELHIDQDNGIFVAAVNMSLGTTQLFELACDDQHPLTKAAIDNLRSYGVATVVASGNSSETGSISAPACISSAIAVGATTTKYDELADFSNHSDLIELLAPGADVFDEDEKVGILSAEAHSVDQYVPKGGTSMATPHVAGSFAVLRTLFPDTGVVDLLGALKDGGVAISTRSPTRPRIDLMKTYIILSDASLRVVLEPEAARLVGARWSLGGGAWLESGVTVGNLEPDGVYALSFSDLDANWQAPADESVTLGFGLNERIFVYTALGSLQVHLAPQQALDAGAAWRRVGQPSWRASGDTEQDVAAGSHQVEFRAISGWNTPSRLNVVVAQGETSVYEATYGKMSSGGGASGGLMLLLLLGVLAVSQLGRYLSVTNRLN